MDTAIEELLKKRVFKCKQCETEYIRFSSKQMFCSDACRYKWHNQRPKSKMKDLFAA
jgi:hypothetical protein